MNRLDSKIYGLGEIYGPGGEYTVLGRKYTFLAENIRPRAENIRSYFWEKYQLRLNGLKGELQYTVLE